MNLTRGERFKDARIVYNQHGKQTMDEVAAATGIKKSLIQALEKDENDRDVGYTKVATLAAHYRVTADFLLGFTNDPYPQHTATDDLGLSPAVISKIKSFKDMWPSSCDYLMKINRLLEMDGIWELLLLIDSLHTATKVDEIFRKVWSQEKVIFDVRKKLLDMAVPFYDVDSDMYYFLQYRAHSLSADDTAVSFENTYLTMEELQTARINRMLMVILFDISRGGKDGID